MASQYTIIKHLPPPAECLAILLGCAECIVFGLGGLSSPSDFARGYGLPIDVPTAAESEAAEASGKAIELNSSQKTQQALITALAARHIQNGALILTLALYTRERAALGFAVGFGVFGAVADWIVVRKFGVGELAGGHVIGGMISAGLGGGLLYWGREGPW